MALHTPVYLQPSSGDASIIWTGQELRNYTQAMLTMARGVGSPQGVNAAAALKVTQHATPNLTLDVASGYAWVIGDDTTAQSVYMVWNDATVTTGNLTVPGAGTFHHRVVLQIQDKLANGVWSGYQAAVTVLPDVGGGLIAEPASAITLATVDVPTGSATITNSMINDFREAIGGVQVTKSADTGRTSASLIDDPDLQLLNLAANAEYEFEGQYFYAGASSGDFSYGWRVSSGTHMSWQRSSSNLGGSVADGTMWTEGTVQQSQATGTGNPFCVGLQGRISTAGSPAYVVTQWAPNAAVGTTTVKLRSWLRARRVA